MKKSKDLPILRNQIYSLVLFGKIRTTKARAKTIQGLIDKLVNKIKKDTVAAKREVLRILPRRDVTEKLAKELIPNLGGRSSGYTRVIKLGQREGDGAPLVVMEWVTEEGLNEQKVIEAEKGTQEPKGTMETKVTKSPEVPKKKNDKTNKDK